MQLIKYYSLKKINTLKFSVELNTILQNKFINNENQENQSQ